MRYHINHNGGHVSSDSMARIAALIGKTEGLPPDRVYKQLVGKSLSGRQRQMLVRYGFDL